MERLNEHEDERHSRSAGPFNGKHPHGPERGDGHQTRIRSRWITEAQSGSGTQSNGAALSANKPDAEAMKFPVPMESWRYRNPEAIGDGLLAETERREKAEARRFKVTARAKKDGFYRQSKSVHFKALVKIAKRGGFKNGR